MSTRTAHITYRKTKTGEWVLYGPLSAFQYQGDGPGIYTRDSVTVTKRDGTTKTEQVARLGKPFQVDGREMVYGYIERTAVRPAYERGCKSGTGDCLSFGVRGCWSCGG